MPDRPRWARHGLLAVVAAAVVLASITIDPVVEPAAPSSAPNPAEAPVVPGFVPGPEPIRIMPLGSSSTVGTGSTATAGFRGPLEKLLVRDHIAFDLVGSQRSGPAWLKDRDHEGHGGATMAQMQPFVAEWVARQEPDVILLQVGTNDLIAGIGAAATAQRLDTMLTTIGTVSKAQVIVAGIWAPLPGQAAARAHFTRLAAAVVARHRGTTFVDTSALLAPTDLFDGLHPDAGGYRKIARMWERGIRSYLLAGGQARRPDLRSTDMVAGFRVSSPAGGISIPMVRTSATPSATPSSAPSSAPTSAQPGSRPDQGRPDATPPLVRTLTGHAPTGGSAAVRAGHRPLPRITTSPAR